MYLWRAVDSEGEILDLLVQPRRDKAAALRLMRKLVRKQGYGPRVLVTDRLQSYAAARRQLGLSARQEVKRVQAIRSPELQLSHRLLLLSGVGPEAPP
jgi:transposase-like protein